PGPANSTDSVAPPLPQQPEVEEHALAYYYNGYYDQVSTPQIEEFPVPEPVEIQENGHSELAANEFPPPENSEVEETVSLANEVVLENVEQRLEQEPIETENVAW